MKRKHKVLTRKILTYVMLINISAFLLVIVPFAKGAEAGALPISPVAVMEDLAEPAAVAILRAEGWRIVESQAARATVRSMYSRLTPAGQAYFDQALSAAVNAEKSPLWAKAIIPTALVAEIGSIMVGLKGDSDAGKAIDYNAPKTFPVVDSTVLYDGMPELCIVCSIHQKSMGAIWVLTHLNNSGTQSDQLKVPGLPPGSDWITTTDSGYNKAVNTFITSITITDSKPTINDMTFSVNFHWVDDLDGKIGNLVKQYLTPAQIGQWTATFGVQTAVFSELIPNMVQESDAVTGTGNAPQGDTEVIYPKPEAGITFDDFNKQVNDDPTTVQDVAPVPDTAPEPVDHAPADGSGDWWKWLTAPLAEILKLLQQLWDWLKQVFGNIPNWFSSILSKLADLLGSLGSLLTQLGDWFGTLWDQFSELFQKLGQWFSDLFDKLGAWFSDLFDKLGAWFGTLWDWLGNIAAAIGAIPAAMGAWLMDNLVGDPAEVEWGKLKQTGAFFTTKFPFSLPWDISNSLSAAFNGVGSEVPHYTLKVYGHEWEVTLPQMFQDWTPFVRSALLIMFDIGLVYSTRKLLGGAS